MTLNRTSNFRRAIRESRKVDASAIRKAMANGPGSRGLNRFALVCLAGIAPVIAAESMVKSQVTGYKFQVEQFTFQLETCNVRLTFVLAK